MTSRRPRTPPPTPVSFAGLARMAACLMLAELANAAALPLWVTFAVAALAALRVALAYGGLGPPPSIVRWLLLLPAVALVFVQFRTFNGVSAGTALLSLTGGLKLVESKSKRDLHVITLIIYFLCLAALLQSESFWLLGYSILLCSLTTASLLQVSGTGSFRADLRYVARLLLQAAPLAAACWLLFPRFSGPLWHLPNSDGGATVGLSDSMTPGDINDLALSDEIAFRVRFQGASPPPAERYWRGPVLHNFDGRTWRRSLLSAEAAPPLRTLGNAYRYTVSIEADQRNWIFVLDWPAQWDDPHAVLTSDYMLVQPEPIAKPLDVSAVSYPHVESAPALSGAARGRDTRLPRGSNLRSLALALQLRGAHPDDADYVRAVLTMFHEQPFYYTLTPPKLAADSVDEFLFGTRRGFCGHYASAFAMLMRAAGIPARVVTGYQGGTYNRFADYWILRQSDAHAWDEIWIDGKGWMRIDPTSVIDPARVDRGMNDLVFSGQSMSSRWQQRTPWLTDTRLRLDALRLLWRQRFMSFDQGAQDRLLERLHVPEPDGRKLAILLAACLIFGMALLTWQVRRDLNTISRDSVSLAYTRLCRRLAAVGLTRLPHEGAECFASRVGARRPDLEREVTDLCRRYSDLRYAADAWRGSTAAEGAMAADRAIAEFIVRVRRFRPRRSDSRASS